MDASEGEIVKHNAVLPSGMRAPVRGSMGETRTVGNVRTV